MFKNGDYNSFMILGLANTLTNNGLLKNEDRRAIFELGYQIEAHHTLDKAKKLLKEINEILKSE